MVHYCSKTVSYCLNILLWQQLCAFMQQHGSLLQQNCFVLSKYCLLWQQLCSLLQQPGALLQQHCLLFSKYCLLWQQLCSLLQQHGLLLQQYISILVVHIIILSLPVLLQIKTLSRLIHQNLEIFLLYHIYNTLRIYHVC